MAMNMKRKTERKSMIKTHTGRKKKEESGGTAMKKDGPSTKAGNTPMNGTEKRRAGIAKNKEIGGRRKKGKVVATGGGQVKEKVMVNNGGKIQATGGMRANTTAAAEAAVKT